MGDTFDSVLEDLSAQHISHNSPISQSVARPILKGDALHGLVGDIVHTIEPHSEADPAGLAAVTLAEFGAQVGPTPHALADSAEHPARLYVALVGSTAKGRKGTVSANIRRVTGPADLSFSANRRLNGICSGEALVDAVRGDDDNSDHRLLVEEPEFARILNVARRDHSTLSQVIRQAWDGGRLQVRSRASTSIAENSHVCVIGNISADELRLRLTDTEVASGFANRFLYVYVERSKLLPSGGNLDERDVLPLTKRMRDAVSASRKVGILRRTPDAEAYWADIYHQMDEDDPGGLLSAVIARAAAQTLRLSVAYALLDCSCRIDLVHVKAAYAMWQYCRDSADYIWGDAIGNAIADRMLTAIRAAGKSGARRYRAQQGTRWARHQGSTGRGTPSIGKHGSSHHPNR